MEWDNQAEKFKDSKCDFGGWRSLGESNPCFSLESAKLIRSMIT